MDGRKEEDDGHLLDDGEGGSEREISTCGGAAAPVAVAVTVGSLGCKISDSRKIPDPHQLSPSDIVKGHETERVDVVSPPRRPPPPFLETRGQSNDTEEP